MGYDVLRVAPAASARAASTGTASVPMKILISPEATWLITGRGVELCSTSNPRRRLPDIGGYCGDCLIWVAIAAAAAAAAATAALAAGGRKRTPPPSIPSRSISPPSRSISPPPSRSISMHGALSCSNLAQSPQPTVHPSLCAPLASFGQVAPRSARFATARARASAWGMTRSPARMIVP